MESDPKTRTSVYVTTQFEGFHRWPNASRLVGFLADLHRHVFHVKLWCKVTHDDRDREFILLKREVDETVGVALDGDVETWSCEVWARYLLENTEGAWKVEVSEDGENGAVIEEGAPWV